MKDTCPYCQSTHIEKSEVYEETPEALEVTVDCLDCGAYWKNSFEFTNYYINEDITY